MASVLRRTLPEGGICDPVWDSGSWVGSGVLPVLLLPADPAVEVPAARSLVVPVLLGRWVLPLLLGGVTFPSSLSSTLFGGWVLPKFEETSKVEGNGICSASELLFGSEFEASVQPVVFDDTESECSVAVSSLVWLRTIDWSLPMPYELSDPSAPRLKWG